LSEEAVLFLSAEGKRAGVYHVVGDFQGRMSVRQNTIHPLASDVHAGVSELTRHEGRASRISSRKYAQFRFGDRYWQKLYPLPSRGLM